MMTREQAVEVAQSWLGTPYRLKGRVKQGGCDCGTYLAEYIAEIGGKVLGELPYYKSDWFLHTKDDRYIKGIMLLAKQTAEGICQGDIPPVIMPGDVMLFRHKSDLELYTHGAVVVKFPTIIHCVRDGGVSVANATQHVLTAFRHYTVHSPWEHD